MPSASAELRKFAETHFGNLDCGPVAEELERRGFHQTKEYCWKRGRGPDDFERSCIEFLIQEWDWGGYVED